MMRGDRGPGCSVRYLCFSFNKASFSEESVEAARPTYEPMHTQTKKIYKQHAHVYTLGDTNQPQPRAASSCATAAAGELLEFLVGLFQLCGLVRNGHALAAANERAGNRRGTFLLRFKLHGAFLQQGN